MLPERYTNDEGRRFAVVTGASSGIGFQIARALAAEGWDLLIAANEADELAEAERTLREGAPDRRITREVGDLTRAEAVEALVGAWRATGRRLDGLVANAGIGNAGAFSETPLEQELDVVDLNVRSQVHLVRRALDDMKEAGGRILITASIAALAPTPHIATYGASKAFLRSFGLALREELKHGPVSVTVLMPGAADTGFWERNGMEDSDLAGAAIDSPEFIARGAVDAFLKGDATTIPGLKAKAGALAGKLAPGRLQAAVLSGLAKPE